MAITKLSASGVVNFVKYRSMLAGNPPYEPPAPSAYDLLETEILTGTQASVTFSSLNSTYGADYQHLQIRYAGTMSATSYCFLYFNGDETNTNYYSHALYGYGTTIGSEVNNSPRIMYQWTGGYVGAGVFDVLDAFSTSKLKTVRGFYGDTIDGVGVEALISTKNNSTAATTSLKLALASGAFAVGSRFSLYGLRSS
jgi:hypothetical protein